MGLEDLRGFAGQERSRERRREKLERQRSFANYIDRVSEEVRNEIEQLSWDIADELTEKNNELGKWYGNAEFKLRLQKILKQYFSGFNRDQESLMSDNLSDVGDREVTEQAFLEADKHLSKFSDLEIDETESGPGELSSEDSFIDEAGNDQADSSDLVGEVSDDDDKEMVKEKVWRPHANEVPSERPRFGERTQEEIDRLNEQLHELTEEIRTWGIDTTERYEEVVSLLMREHGLKLNDAILCLRGNTNLPRWTEGKLIRELMDGKQDKVEEKDRGMSR